MNIVYQAIIYLLQFVEYAVIARILLSWLPIPRDNTFVRILYQLTEPILSPVRALLERSAIGKNSMLDFSPMVALLLIWLVRNIVARLLISGF